MTDILTCPDCGADMSPAAVDDTADVVCGLVLACDCGASFGVGQVYWPDDAFTLVAAGADGPCARCGAPADRRVQPVGEAVSERCVACLPAYLCQAYTQRPLPEDT